MCFKIYMADLVIPNPECRTRDIMAEDEFLIIASDGLWDVISTIEAVEMARFIFHCDFFLLFNYCIEHY